MFIGVYNLANFITLLGLASALLACVFAQRGYIRLALCMFLLSGLCDMFDGRIARGAGSRTRREKVYGIQIDTICDMVSFGVTPVFILYSAGFDGWHDVVVYIIYSVCAAIRLSYFNTQAIEETPDLNMKSFTGVPVPFSCIALPPLLIAQKLIKNTAALNVLADALVFAIGAAFILNVKIKKLNITESVFLIIFELVCLIAIFLM